ncbi:ABC transporter substrate-binding protein [Geodermatophilus sp. CPCC 206100]|uniref:ABC transporter substrate-binding protein n=1 Tax=Geodermatophilus sp. CPCC 206100 TaxID=3020054 RepID=UPI003B00DDFA
MSGMRRHPVRAVAAAAGLCLLLASCGGSDSDAAAGGGGGGGGGGSAEGGESMDDLYQAAQEAGEDTVVVYGIKTGTACYDQFSQEYSGITVQTQYMVGETQARLQQEHVSGQNVGDVLRTGNTSMLALIRDGILTEYVPADVEGISEAAYGPENAMINDSQRLSGIAYNSANVPDAEAPKSWDDLVDPQFKGRIVMPDPTVPGAGLSILQSLMDTGVVDDEWLEALAANEPAFIQGVQPAIEALKTGEYDVMLGGLDQITGPALEEGTDLRYVFPVEGATPLTKHYTGVITNAPHPNAARLLTSWLVSEDGQTCLATEENEMPVREGVAPPEGIPALDELPNVAEQKPASFDELDAQTELLTKFKEIFAG